VPHSNGAPWIAELTRRIRGEAVFTHFILTRDAVRQSEPRCRYLGTRASAWLDWQHDGFSANSLDLGSQSTLLVASAPYGRTLESPELTTDAELAVAYLDSRGKPRCWIMARGTTLTVGKRTLTQGKRRDWAAG